MAAAAAAATTGVTKTFRAACWAPAPALTSAGELFLGGPVVTLGGRRTAAVNGGFKFSLSLTLSLPQLFFVVAVVVRAKWEA